MNASSLPASGLPTTSISESRPRRRSILFSLTGVCFLFGGLLALQMRAIESVHDQQAQDKVRVAKEQQIAASLRRENEKGARERQALTQKINSLTATIAQTGTLSKKQVAALAAQVKELQSVAGLTPVSGPGVRLVLSDNPAMVQAGADPSLMQPGLVHDFDLLQVVNELRASKADAITVRGEGGAPIRITGYTPIRCVGSTILINWEPVAAPFTVEAIGSPKALRSALEMPQGVVDNLRNQGAIGVKITSEAKLEMPAAEGGVPKLRAAL